MTNNHGVLGAPHVFRHTWGRGAAALIAVVVLAGCSSSGGSGGSNPKLAKAAALAKSGDASALTFVRQINRPFAGCQRPNYTATVSRGVTGRALAADELAFFAARTDLDQKDCSAFLYVFFDDESATSEGFTAGAVLDEDRGIEVHVGGITSSPYVTYDYN